MSAQMASILYGTQELIDDWLGLRIRVRPVHYWTTTAWNTCSAEETRNGCVFVRSLLCVVYKNCRG